MYNLLLFGYNGQVNTFSPSHYSYPLSSYYLLQPPASCDQRSIRLHDRDIALTLTSAITIPTQPLHHNSSHCIFNRILHLYQPC